MTASNDEILNGEHNGEWFMMCRKCGDNYKVTEQHYKRNRNVRWRCKSCVYDLF